MPGSWCSPSTVSSATSAAGDSHMHAAAKFILQNGENRKRDETLLDNVFWAGAAARLSVVIPAFRYDASDLIDTLARCQSSQLAEIIVYDDGSRDHDLLARMETAAG